MDATTYLSAVHHVASTGWEAVRDTAQILRILRSLIGTIT